MHAGAVSVILSTVAIKRKSTNIFPFTKKKKNQNTKVTK